MSVTVEEAKKARDELCNAIGTLILNFEGRTELRVESISLQHDFQKDWEGEAVVYTQLVYVRAEVKL